MVRLLNPSDRLRLEFALEVEKMSRNSRKIVSVAFLIICVAALHVRAQENVSTATALTQETQPTQEELQKQKEVAEQKAFALLEQLLTDVQMLKLPENRIRIQISAADLLWDHNQGRARSLLSLAADSVAEVLRNPSTEQGRGRNSGRSVNQLRRELVFAAARHDASLAYQLLAATRTFAPTTGGSRGANADENLEQDLLAQIAALDPKVALQNAEQLLAKGELPRSLANVLGELQSKDPEAATKLEEKILRSLKSANMLGNRDASGLALSLLAPGPRLSEPVPGTDSNQRTPLLALSAYQELMATLIEAALKATPQSASTNQRGSNNTRRAGANRQINTSPTDAQSEQSNARRLLNGLQSLLPMIDQYVPSRAQAVRQKLTELSIGDNQRSAFRQLLTGSQQANVDNLLAAAPKMPPRFQARVYEQAALKALDDGNPERAGQIANDHLDTAARNRVLQRIEFRKISEQFSSERLEVLQQKLASLASDDERVDLLLRLAADAQPKDPDVALKLLNEARQYTARRATSYQQFERQLKVAEAFRLLEPARSFETLEPGISQLNELLSAAATLSGFEVNVFRDGELPLQGGSNLNGMVARYGQVIGSLARSDGERAEALANRFQFSEPRIIVRLAIVRALLGLESRTVDDGRNRVRGSGQSNFMIRPEE